MKLLLKFTKWLSNSPIKITAISCIVVAIISSGTTALVLMNTGSTAPAKNTNEAQLTTSSASLPVDVSAKKANDLSSSQQNTTTTNQDWPNNTKATAPTPSTPAPAPTPSTPAPTPTYLTTCVYVGGSQNGENCPYNPPPAWNGSFTKYYCTTGVNYMVACLNYQSVTQIDDEGIQYYGDSSTTGYVGYYGSCSFISGSIARRVYVDVNGRTSGNADCLTGTPLP